MSSETPKPFDGDEVFVSSGMKVSKEPKDSTTVDSATDKKGKGGGAGKGHTGPIGFTEKNPPGDGGPSRGGLDYINK